MQQIDVIGQKVFDIIMNATYWIVGTTAATDMLRHITRRDYENALKALLYSGMAFAGMQAIRIILDLIKGVFA